MGKPVAVLGVAGRGLHARASLDRGRDHDGRVIFDASVTLAVRRNLTALEIAADAGMAGQLRAAPLALTGAA